jgi:cyclic beta-1,2-glucan synthetase
MHDRSRRFDAGPWRAWTYRPGGVYLLRSDRLPEREITLLLTVARAVLHGDRGTLANQLDRPAPAREGRDAGAAPEARPRQATASRDEPAPLEKPTLRLFNGIGGFTADGREYEIVLDGNRETPLPWVNVIANPMFGTIVSASGSAFTWPKTAARIASRPSGTIRSATRPAKRCSSATMRRVTRGRPRRGRCAGRLQRPCVIRHGAGDDVPSGGFGIDHDLAVFVAPSEPVKVSLLTLTNRRVAAAAERFQLQRMGLGPPQADQQRHGDGARRGIRALLARTLRRRFFRPRGLRSRSESLASATADRSSFIGATALSHPSALSVSSCPIGSAPDSIRAGPHVAVSLAREKRAGWFSLGQTADVTR